MAAQEYAAKSMAKFAEPYFGRAAGVGVNANFDKFFCVWTAEGRSYPTQNRIAIVDPSYGLVRTDYHKRPDGPPDPNIIYTSMRSVTRLTDGKICHIVSNGDQTNTAAEALLGGEFINSALERLEHEDD